MHAVKVFSMVLAAIVAAPLFVGAADPPAAAKPDAAAAPLDMFEGINNGQIAVRLIPRDSKEARVLVENKTDKPLTVKLPDSFAGAPVLAQRQAQTTQGVGGGLNRLFNVPPEKVGQLKVATVCLDHGKPEPRANIPYEIKPVDGVTTNPGVRELLEMFGRGGIDQGAAQAAAWHLNNGMTWQQLAAERIRFANGGGQPYFNPQQLRAAMQLSARALQLAQQRQQQPPQSTSESAAQ